MDGMLCAGKAKFEVNPNKVKSLEQTISVNNNEEFICVCIPAPPKTTSQCLLVVVAQDLLRLS